MQSHPKFRFVHSWAWAWMTPGIVCPWLWQEYHQGNNYSSSMDSIPPCRGRLEGEKWLQNCYFGPHTQYCWKEGWCANKNFIAVNLRLKTAPFWLHSKLRTSVFFHRIQSNSGWQWLTEIAKSIFLPVSAQYASHLHMVPQDTRGIRGERGTQK